MQRLVGVVFAVALALAFVAALISSAAHLPAVQLRAATAEWAAPTPAAAPGVNLQAAVAGAENDTSLTSEARAPTASPRAERARDANALPTMLLFGVSTGGVGNQMMFLHRLLWMAMVLGDADVALPGMEAPKGSSGPRKKAPAIFSAFTMSVFDLDALHAQLRLRVRNFESSCACVDYVLKARHMTFSKHTLRGIDRVLPESYYKDYRTLIPPAGPMRVPVEVGQDASPRTAWDLFPEERTALLEGRAPSRCGNLVRCVLASMDISQRDLLTSELRRSTSFENGTNAITHGRYISGATVPSTFLIEASRMMLPLGFESGTTLIAHLRYEMGEYNREPELCQNPLLVCLGRNRLYEVMTMRDFGEQIRALASKLGCKHVFPILPRQFMNESLASAIAAEFALTTEDLVSSRKVPYLNVLLYERTLAVISHGFVSETRGTTFSATINRERIALGLSSRHHLESVVSKYTVRIDDALRAKLSMSGADAATTVADIVAAKLNRKL